MKSLYKLIIPINVLAAALICGNAHAQTAAGGGDPFTLWFDEDGNGTYSENGGPITPAPWSIALVDPNTGLAALTYLLPENITPGVVDIAEPDGSVGDALSFYNVGAQGYMAYYSTLPGTDLADTVSAGFIPAGPVVVTEDANENFTWLPGGNVYYGVSGEATVPDGGSTLAMLGGAMGLFAAVSRKLRK